MSSKRGPVRADREATERRGVLEVVITWISNVAAGPSTRVADAEGAKPRGILQLRIEAVDFVVLALEKSA